MDAKFALRGITALAFVLAGLFIGAVGTALAACPASVVEGSGSSVVVPPECLSPHASASTALSGPSSSPVDASVFLSMTGTYLPGMSGLPADQSLQTAQMMDYGWVDLALHSRHTSTYVPPVKPAVHGPGR